MMDNNKYTQFSICQRISTTIVRTIEKCFYRYGYIIACHPWWTILGCVVLSLVSSLGLLRFYQEKHPLKLWIPPNSDFSHDTEWLITQFGEGIRIQAVLVTAPDVLTPHVLQQLGEIHQRVVNISNSEVSWEDVCFRIPVIDFSLKRKKRQINDNQTNPYDQFGNEDYFDQSEPDLAFDPSVILSEDIYCAIVNNLRTACLERSLLEFWEYDPEVLKMITKEDILSALNITTVSPVFGHPMSYTHLLGGIKRNETGYILSASSLMMFFMVHVNFSAVNMEESGNDAGTADWATGPILAWEKMFLQVMADISYDDKEMKIFYEAGRSYGDISSSVMFQDVDKLIFGIIMMFIYVQIIVSKFNMVEFRFFLGVIGLLSVGMAFVVACGICSLLGIPYGPVHTALPFLLMGIGVDDVFVIMACWKNLTSTEKKLILPEKIALTMQYAGSSITVTSMTDVIAFLVGAFTILPSLQSFCLYAAVGVFVTFVFQATLFVACLVLDERRIQKSYNGIVICYKHQNHRPCRLSQRECSKSFFHALFSNVILTLPGKICIVLLTLGFGIVSTIGLIQLKQEFDPMWFLPDDSHLYKFIVERSKFYPDLGKDASVYMGKLNYSAELQNIQNVILQFKQESNILKDVEEWYSGFRYYLKRHFNTDVATTVLSDIEFSNYISKYLFSPSGAKFQKNFRFEGKLQCGYPAPPIKVSSFDFKFKLFHGPQETLPAMNRVKQIVREANFTTGDHFAFVWGKIFANWVTDEVIDTEVYRNLMLACLCVMICTTFMIANFVTCFLIFICVLLTLVNVAGMMFYWGLTIDIVSCIGLELASGLCVDYAAHVGHNFLTCNGSNNNRALKVVTDMGSAIVSGGISTLLALSVLAFSQSYIFSSFFKIFLLVVLYGLFHGVVFLPVVLSVVGPAPYPIPHLPQSVPSQEQNITSNDTNVWETDLEEKTCENETN